jgi:hypothetical protein
VEPTSTFAGVLTGLVDGSIIAAVVFVVIYLASRRNHPRPVPSVHPVAEDGIAAAKTPEGELPKSG